MTDEPGTDDVEPAESVDPDRAQQELADAKRSRDLRKALQEVKLKGRPTYMIGPTLLGVTHATFRGAGISRDGGDIEIVGRLMVAFGRLLNAVGADVITNMVHFTNSVTIDVLPVVTPDQREQIEHLAETRGDEVVRKRDLDIVVPRPVVAVDTALYVLSAQPDRVAHRAAIAGAATRTEVQKMSRELGRHHISLEVQTPTTIDQPVRVGTRRAQAFEQRLKDVDPLEPREITVRGRLTRADSDTAEFRIVLDPNYLPVELSGTRRRYIEGSYAEEAEAQVRDGGLWDTYVSATLMMTLARPAGGGRPRPDEFEFLSVEPTH